MFLKVIGLVLLVVIVLNIVRDDSLFFRGPLTLSVRNKANDLAKFVAQKIRENEKEGEAR